MPYVATVPGPQGIAAALIAEIAIAFGLMSVILLVTLNHHTRRRCIFRCGYARAD